MPKIEMVVALHLAQDERQRERCKKEIMDYLTTKSAFENIALLGKGPENKTEAELFFGFAHPVSLNELLAVIVQSDARIEAQYFMLPSSLSGITSAYDARDYGEYVTSTVKQVAGVIGATVSTTGSLRMECCTPHLDELLEQVIAALNNMRKQ